MQLDVVTAFSEASPDELRMVLDQAPIGIVVLRGPDLVYEYVNPMFQAFAPTVPLIGRRFAEASWELAEVRARLEEVWATGRPWRASDLEVNIERAEGRPLERATFSIGCVKVSRRDPPDALLGFVMETTPQVRALEQEQRHGAELESIIETMLEGVIVFDRDHNVTLINSAAWRLLQSFTGQVPSDPEGARRLLRDIDGRWPDGKPIDPQMIPMARALAGEACRSTVLFTNPLTRRDVYASIGAAPIRDADGKVAGAVTVGSDVTEMTELDRLKEEFIRQIAHELKTPITIMKGYASMLVSTLGSSVSPAHARMLQAIGRGADRINRIMCELLDAQQIDLGRFDVTTERVDLVELLQDIVDRAAAASPRHELKLSAARPVTLFADPERLRELMRILLDNAIRYSPDGGEVEVTLREAPDGVQIAVRDHGVGIPLDRQRRVFQRFYRAHVGTAHDYGGTGLGLYVARTIAELHGGAIWFESQEGRGTTFTFQLPWRPARARAG